MNDTPDILKKIIKHKLTEIAERKQQVPIDTLQRTVEKRDFIGAIASKVSQQQTAIIAEIKKASPSKGVIREDFDPLAIAKIYQDNGACCFSVLTDEHFFQGRDEYLQLIRNTYQLPTLRKDFIIDPYQIHEANALGADCILLIAACLDDSQLQSLTQLANELHLDVLIEVHNEAELHRVLPLNTRLIGINSRDLHTFNTDIQTSIELVKQIPDDRIVVTESGINSPADIELMHRHGIYAFLIGESLMREQDPGIKLRELLKI